MRDLKSEANSYIKRVRKDYIVDIIAEHGTELDAARNAIKDASTASPYEAISLLNVASILASQRLDFEINEVIEGMDINDPEDRKRLKEEMEYASECYVVARSAVKKAVNIAAKTLNEEYSPSDIAEVYYGIAIAWDWVSYGYENFQEAYRKHSNIIKRNPSRRR